MPEKSLWWGDTAAGLIPEICGLNNCINQFMYEEFNGYNFYFPLDILEISKQYAQN